MNWNEQPATRTDFELIAQVLRCNDSLLIEAVYGTNLERATIMAVRTMQGLGYRAAYFMEEINGQKVAFFHNGAALQLYRYLPVVHAIHSLAAASEVTITPADYDDRYLEVTADIVKAIRALGRKVIATPYGEGFQITLEELESE